MVKVNPGDENIFNITQPGRYRCQILHYHNRLSRLYLSVSKDRDTVPAFYLLFSDVGYMQLPSNWQGVNFSIAEKQTCIDLMLETGLIGPAILQYPDAYAAITDHAYLFEVQTGSKPVQVIAGSASMLRTLPADIA